MPLCVALELLYLSSFLLYHSTKTKTLSLFCLRSLYGAPFVRRFQRVQTLANDGQTNCRTIARTATSALKLANALRLHKIREARRVRCACCLAMTTQTWRAQEQRSLKRTNWSDVLSLRLASNESFAKQLLIAKQLCTQPTNN